MNKIKRFLTVFFPTEQVHLHKDVGMIPYALSRYCRWSTALMYIDDKGIIQDQDYEKYVRLIPINVSKIFVIKWIRIILFIICNSWKYNVVNFYHITKLNLLLAILFKLFNPCCQTYIKLDLDQKAFINIITECPLTFIKKIKRHLWILLLDIFFDKYSVETESFYQVLKSHYIFKNKIFYIPNGILVTNDMTNIQEKENIILTVGRIGNFIKNNEMLVQAIIKIEPEIIKQWKVCFVGPVDKKFNNYIEKVIGKYPHLQEVFILTGNINDKSKLYDIYARAKVFCLTSRSEGFPLVLPEALIFGNYIITTNFPSAYDLTENNTIGSIIEMDDVERLKDLIENIIRGKIQIEKFSEISFKLAYEKFNWERISMRLEKYLAWNDD